MNVVKILLVVGLGYVALTQKSEKTRNMLLVVTGLLAFCMFSLEGFNDITFTSGAGSAPTITSPTARAEAGGTITSAGAIYTFPAAFNVSTQRPTWTCATGKTPGSEVTVTRRGTPTLTATNINSVFPCVQKQLCSAATTPPGTCSAGTKKTGSADYCAGATCAATDFATDTSACCQTSTSQLCSAGKDSETKQCPSGWPDYYKIKAGIRCAATDCVAADFDTTTGICCEPVCSDAKCNLSWPWKGVGADCGIFSKCE